jgi:hypothetical protein
VIALIFPSLCDDFNADNQDENYFHIELDVLFKFLTNPHENIHHDEAMENSTNFSRARKYLNHMKSNTRTNERNKQTSVPNLALTIFIIDKLLQRSQELIRIIDLINSFTLNQTQNQLNKTLNTKMSRKSYASNMNSVLDFDSIYLLLVEEFFLDLKILSFVVSNESFVTLKEKIMLLRTQTSNLLQLVGVYLRTRLNNNFDGLNSRLTTSICNYILSEMTLKSYLSFSLNNTLWKMFLEIMVETNFIEICWDICSFQQQNITSNETTLYENTQSLDDYEIDQENLNS